MALNRLPAVATGLCLTVTLGTGACSAQSPNSAGHDRPRGPSYTAGPEQRRGGDTFAEDDPQSTFAVDVDTASYGYTRRIISDRRLPDKETVRPEEFVNAFAQDYPEPAGDGFAVHLDGARMPHGHHPQPPDAVHLLRVGLQTRSDDTETRPDAALTFVVDVSGSMGEPGRLDLVQDALHTLVDQLRPTDAVALVAFSGRARVVREMTPLSDADELHDAIDSLHTESSTNLEAGLVLGYRVARDGFRRGASNRVVILSDGLANVGNTEAEPILRRVREEAAKQIGLLGVGVGSEYGDELMERLADRGDGFAVYVSQRAQAREVFVRQLPATLSVRALDAKVQVTFDPAVVRSYRLIGYDNRAIADEDFRDDRVDGGEVGPGHSVTALYEVRLADEAARSARVAGVQVRWLDPKSRDAAETYESISVGNLDRDFDRASPRLRTCYAAAYFAEYLRSSEEAREVGLGTLAAVASRAAEETDDHEVRELVEIIDGAAELD